MSNQFKKEVLEAFQKVSPSKIQIEDEQKLHQYRENHYNLFQNKLKFPVKMFKDSKVLNFGCGTGEVDVVLAKWGAYVEGFDFNHLSIERANNLRVQFNLQNHLSFYIGDVDEYKFQPESYDIVISTGVIPHVPNQENMFMRMAQACKKDGFIVLGYVESSGLIQRLLHRTICNINNDGNEQKVYDIAKKLFSEHIERSVKYGGRTAESVINDYLVNPHYLGISIKTLFDWMDKYNLEFYSMTPSIELPFTVDSPYHESLVKNTDLYRKYLTLHELRWIFSQAEDQEVFTDLLASVQTLETTIDSMLDNVNEILQNFKYEKIFLDKIITDLNLIEIEIQNNFANISRYVNENFHVLKNEFIKILEMIVNKVKNNQEFDLNFKSDMLFKGYNGLTTNYIIFHKKV